MITLTKDKEYELNGVVFKTLPHAIEALNRKCKCAWEPFAGGNVPRIDICGELYTPWVVA